MDQSRAKWPELDELVTVVPTELLERVYEELDYAVRNGEIYGETRAALIDLGEFLNGTVPPDDEVETP